MNNICGICSDILDTNLAKLNCGHIYHYECIKMAYKSSAKAECPYCRQYGGKLKKMEETCIAINKTGKNKGCRCKNKIKIGKYCGRHLNYEKNNII